MKHSRSITRTCAIFAGSLLFIATAAAQQPRRISISVDMEGIGGVGTPAMTSASGKDYELARRLMTDEVNAVVAAIFESGPATVLVNDSHGDMQNLLHTELDPRVTYIQGAVKPVGMVAGLDSTFDAAFFIGYHARAGRTKQLDVGKPVRVRMRFNDTALPQILEAIPGVKRVDGYTVGFTAASMTEAYPIIRLMYRFVRI